MNHRTRLAALAAAALAAAPAAAQAPRTHGPLTFAPRPTTGEITAQDLRTRVYQLAADSMMGREAGTRGNVMATDYIAAEARRIGLLPAGEDGTFFQQVPLVRRGVAEGAALRVDGGPALAFGTDFLLVPTYGSVLRFADRFDARGVQVVYGGRVGDEAGMISPQAAAGKLVVFAAPLGPNGQPASQFYAGGRTYERYADAAGVAFATLDYTSPGLAGFFREPRTELAVAAPVEEGPRFPAGLIITTAAAEQLLGTPLAGAQVGAAGRTATGTGAWFERALEFPARNVVAVLPGSDPALRGQYVAIGAHNDHVGMTHEPLDHDSLLAFNRILRPQGLDQEPDAWTDASRAAFQAELARLRALGPARLDSVFNGADDDASGTAGLLEIAQYFASRATAPRRSILFVWHTAEEMGLYGSEYFTDHPTVPLDSIVAQLNVDMIGRGAAGDVAAGGPGYLELVGSRRLSTELGDLVEEVNRTGAHGFAFDYGMDADNHPQNIYCRSDHWNYARYGIPVTFFTTGGHSEYHMLTDEPQYVEFEKLARVVRLVGAVAEAVADRDARLVVDKPRPDPNAPCRQ
ncbi:MAG: M28 family peptidase [Gemmatimonadetes bacterium]|nr:M28 family peptidase [Gemmatimonadota bacterium]